jgi:uncharacterized protein YaeQ
VARTMSFRHIMEPRDSSSNDKTHAAVAPCVRNQYIEARTHLALLPTKENQEQMMTRQCAYSAKLATL